MTTLLDLQRAMRTSLVDRDDRAVAALLAGGVPADRLNIYRNTFVTGVTKALRLTYPAVHRLVGAEFFEGAAATFIAQRPPQAAWLDEYGAEFADFLRDFEPAMSLPYLADVARLEWAVSRALHAADEPPLDLRRLQTLSPEDQSGVAFVPHPSISLLRTEYPADAIWRGVLQADDAALAAVDLASSAVHVMIERRASGVEVSRLDETAWRFAAALCAGKPLEVALSETDDTRTYALLAEHLAAGRYIDVRLASDADVENETTGMGGSLQAVPVPKPSYTGDDDG
jgi:hypothetical protein